MGKIKFLYGHYIKLPLARETLLLCTVNRIKPIIGDIARSRNIPKISADFTARYDINIHVLSSHWHLESLLASLASFYACSKEYAEIIIHEDGSFTKRDTRIVKMFFPWAKFIPLKEADRILREKGFSEETVKLRHKHKLLIKAIDFHHIASKDRILIIDTDVFLLDGMGELWSKIKDGAEFVFNEDPKPAYGSSKELLEKVLGSKIDTNPRPCVNTGLIVEPSRILRESKEIIDAYSRGFENFPYERIHCIEQGYIACFLKYKKITESPLSCRYMVIDNSDVHAIEKLKKYDFAGNPENMEVIHLCGWNKLGTDFGGVKKKLIDAMEKHAIKVAFYPNTVFSWPNPLWRMLADGLRKCNIEVIKMKFSFLSLLRNKNRIKVIHFHYVYPDISSARYRFLPGRARNKVHSALYAWQERVFTAKLKLAKGLGYRIIYTAHNTDFHDTPSERAKRNLRLMYKLADEIIAMGKDDKEKLAESTGRNITLIPPFHFDGAYKNTVTKKDAKNTLNIPEDKFVYLNFGNIRRYKGIDLLIKAFRGANPDGILLIAGDTSLDPSYTRELRDLIGGDKKIKVVEYKSPDDVQVFMNAADLAAFPFRQITNSSAVMLAKSFCVPTVCMNKGNTADYANPDTDILVENENEFGKALIEASGRAFPKDKKAYLKNIPGAEEAAYIHRKVYCQP